MRDQAGPDGNVDRRAACKPSVPMRRGCADIDGTSGHSLVFLQVLVYLNWDEWTCFLQWDDAKD